jgi:hypothetical protein
VGGSAGLVALRPGRCDGQDPARPAAAELSRVTRYFHVPGGDCTPAADWMVPARYHPWPARATRTHGGRYAAAIRAAGRLDRGAGGCAGSCPGGSRGRR